MVVNFNTLFPMSFIEGHNWLGILPLLCMTLTAVFTLVLAPLKQVGRALSFAMLLIGSLAAVASIAVFPFSETIVMLDGVLVFDRLSQVFSAVLVLAGLAAAVMTMGYDEREHFQTEFFSLIAFAVVGMMGMVSTRNIVFFFIALELMSLTVYILVAMHRQSPMSAEASLKYFLLGGAASAVMLYGASILYGTTGSLDATVIGSTFQTLWSNGIPILPMVGMALFSIGFLFKIGAFPFHVWVPDVYTGAATPITGFMISAVKAAATGALLRMSLDLFAYPVAKEPVLVGVLGFIIFATLMFGSIVGLRQTRLKRIFAYSTIVHTGYVLLGFLALLSGGAGAKDASSAIVSYTIYYVVMNLGAFAVLTMISPKDDDDLTLDHLTGLGARRPLLAFAMSVFLLSMAGIPPTAGFLGKYYLFSAALASGFTGMTIIAAIASVLSAVIYLRPMVHMYMKESDEAFQAVPSNWFGSNLIVGLSLFLTVVMGLVPAWFSRLL
ncbi:MAG: NADH-quinone oxidoreductase subunit N [Proteobacteria bacterium]|nr:MAG: NADH-quinone oxidoreductase subunit N [Pseudomonadota bacterium]